MKRSEKKNEKKRKKDGKEGELGRAIRETGVASLRCNFNIDMSDWLVLRGEDHRESRQSKGKPDAMEKTTGSSKDATRPLAYARGSQSTQKIG